MHLTVHLVIHAVLGSVDRKRTLTLKLSKDAEGQGGGPQRLPPHHSFLVILPITCYRSKNNLRKTIIET